MPSKELTIHTNGHMALATVPPDHAAAAADAHTTGRRILKSLPASARRYITGMGADVAEMSVLEHQLAKKEQDLKKRIAANADVQQLRRVKAKRKELRQKMQDAVQRIDGVVEAHLDEVMPGATLDEKITALMSTANVKQLEGRRP